MFFPLTMSIGQRLRQERLHLNLTQQRLAAAIGATAMSISRWEHDMTLPQPHYRELLCQIFNQSANSMFSSDELEYALILAA